MDEKNVDGFRLVGIKHLFESEGFENEPLRQDYWKHPHVGRTYDDYQHVYTSNQSGTFEILLEWKNLFEKISQQKNRSKYVSRTILSVSLSKKMHELG